MKNILQRVLIVPILLAIPASVFASASTITEILGVSGNREVTRAEFLKAGVIVLGLPVDFKTAPKQYRAYPDDLAPYVRAADEQKAFDALGDAPDLSQPITRGEAIRLVAELREWRGTGAVLPFRDVDADSELGAAVTLSSQLGWTSPLRNKVFGVNAPLRGKEARAILTRAATDAGRGSEPIIVSSKKRDPIGIQSKKFRDQVQMLLRTEYLYAEKLATASGSTAKQFVESIKDPYTSLFDPTESKQFRDVLSGTITGIGVHLNDEDFGVVSVVEKSPAEKAGIKAGDRIISVNKKRVEGLHFEDVIGRIRGKSGTPVHIGVRRGGDELSFDIIRAAIDIPDTKVEMRNNIAIVTVSQFGDHLINDAPQIFDDLAAADLDGIIIDLRFNPGGYLQAVSSILDEFLPKGSSYLYTRGKNFVDDYETTGEPSIAADVPLVVLTNEGTASSSEIVAGALQDHERATIVGKKTYGKGTVQTVVPFPNKASLKYTIAEWLTPDRHPIDKIGITPDVEVDQTDAGDAQLEKALELILQASR